MASNGTNGLGGQARKAAIVTGGASGIGLAMSQYFASQGYNVAIFDVTTGSGQAVVAELASENPEAKFIFRKCDVSSWQEQATSFKEIYGVFGRIDVVCANAGISEKGGSAMASIKDHEPQKPNLQVLDVNLTGVIYSSKLAIHYMIKNELVGSSRGSIICTASNAGIYPFPVNPLYGASKAGVIGMVRSTAPVLKSHRIQINGLAPAVLGTATPSSPSKVPSTSLCVVSDPVTVTNIAPDKALFKNMVITPMSTLVKGVAQFVSDPSLSGEIAEIHGDSVTLRPPHEFVDEDSRKNLENFWSLGYA